MSVHLLWPQTYICAHWYSKLHVWSSNPPGKAPVACCLLAPTGYQLSLFTNTIHSAIGNFHYNGWYFFIVCFSVGLKLPLLHLWQLYAVQWSQLWLIWWLPPSQSWQQLWISRCSSATTTDPEEHNKRCCWPHHLPQQQPQPLMLF